LARLFVVGSRLGVEGVVVGRLGGGARGWTHRAAAARRRAGGEAGALTMIGGWWWVEGRREANREGLGAGVSEKRVRKSAKVLGRDLVRRPMMGLRGDGTRIRGKGAGGKKRDLLLTTCCATPRPPAIALMGVRLLVARGGREGLWVQLKGLTMRRAIGEKRFGFGFCCEGGRCALRGLICLVAVAGRRRRRR
jgi:hypothetical protein